MSGSEDFVFGSAGFMVLDIVEPSRGNSLVGLHAGGTAGNVAVILGPWGWDSYPLARFPPDDPGFAVLAEDLKRFGVHTEFINLAPTAKFPLLVQRKRSNGSVEPMFMSRCPRCNLRMPGWSSITAETAAKISGPLPRFDVFLIDRFTRGNLDLAAHAKAHGAIIVFEPSSINGKVRAEVNRFQEALRLADMVKYSAQRISDLNDQDFPRTPAIEIQTRGQDGLRYRRRRPDGTMSGWTDLATVAVPNLEDPCGAGDWLTAAVIHLVGTSHHLNLAAMTDEQLRDLLVAGQACGAWACQYAGARGGMYGDPQSLEEFVVQQTGKRHPLAFRNDGKACLSRDTTLVEAMREFCPICRGDWLPPQDGTSPPTGSVGCWQTGPRPGYAGGQAALKQAELTRRYGPGNWRLGYQWHDAMITREQALEKYAEAYFVHLDKHPEVVEWLVKTAKEVYDTAPSNVDAGTDFLVQEGPATHLQDIAVRQALERLGRKFEGGKLVQIRGKSTPGYRLNPGIVLFHEPDAILQPELDGWWQEGTIESFWQSNKVLQVRPWASRLFVFGGSFNPIHNGHLALARFARDTWGFDRVIFVPNGDSYRKKTLAGTPAKVRLEMVQAATVGEPAMEVLDVEVNDPIAIRTPIRMQELSECHPDSQLVLYRGLDSLPRTHRKCFTLLNLFVLVLDRPGFRLPYSEVLARHRKLEPVLDRIIYLGDAFQDDRSSTQVRNAVAAGRPITALVPPAVEKIIHQRGLYGNKQGR